MVQHNLFTQIWSFDELDEINVKNSIGDNSIKMKQINTKMNIDSVGLSLCQADSLN